MSGAIMENGKGALQNLKRELNVMFAQLHISGGLRDFFFAFSCSLWDYLQ